MIKKFVAYFYFIGWDHISLGFHICFGLPNIELHLPFGFVRIGWVESAAVSLNKSALSRRCFGVGY